MKHLLLISFAFIQLQIVAQEINFPELQNSEALISDKPTLVLFYFTGCGSCIQMKKELFSDRSYLASLSKEFNLFQIDILKKPHGVELKSIYKPPAYPVLMMFDAKGEKINQIGVCDKSKFEFFLSAVDNPENSFLSRQNRFKLGEMSKTETVSFFYELADLDLLTKENVDLFCSKLSKEDYQDPVYRKLLYDFIVLNRKPSFDITSPTFLFFKNNLALFSKDFEVKELYYRLIFAYSSPLIDAALSEDTVKMKYYAEAVSHLPDSTKNHKLPFTNYKGYKNALQYGGFIDIFMPFYYYYKKANHKKAEPLLNQFVEKIWGNPELIEYYIGYLKKSFEDEPYIQKIIKLLEARLERFPVPN
jgi:thioredoxin-related protein